MNEHFIKNIEIKNFKCFEDFKAEGFGRVNLIGGKNNVGKTAFMEAVYVNVYAKTLKSFVKALNDIKYMRENLNILANPSIHSIKDFIELSNNISIFSNINNSRFQINEKDGIKEYIFNFNEQDIKVNSKDFSYEINSIDNIKFIDNFGMSNNQIINYYSSIQRKDQEEYLNTLLNTFDSQIKALKIIDEKPQCKVNGKYLEITEFGDGIRHLISIVTSLYACENEYLFIDEIDNGIHYTMLDELWTIILEVSKKLNVQVFATSHSKECIESYARVAKRLEDEEITFIDLGKNKNNEVKAIVMDNERFQREIEMDNEVRGW